MIYIHRNCKKDTADVSKQNIGVSRAKFENLDFFQKKFNSILLYFQQFPTEETKPIKKKINMAQQLFTWPVKLLDETWDH